MNENFDADVAGLRLGGAKELIGELGMPLPIDGSNSRLRVHDNVHDGVHVQVHVNVNVT